MLYRVFLIFLISFFLIAPSYCAITPVDAQRSAQGHNNKGVDYLLERDYIAAIKEFKIAIGINPNSQTTAVYQNNLGRAYLALAKLTSPKSPYAAWAQISFEAAIAQDCMNLNFYKNLVDSFAIRGTLNTKLAYYTRDSAKNPFSTIVVALIYEKRNNKTRAVTILNDFAKTFPDLIITNDIKKHVDTIRAGS